MSSVSQRERRRVAAARAIEKRELVASAARVSSTRVTSASGTSSAGVARLMFVGGLMVRVADVAVTIASFIGLEVIEGLRAAGRHWAVVAVTRIVAVVDVPVEAARPVEPWSRADE